MSSVGCPAGRMIGSASFVPRNSCSACAGPVSRRPISPGLVTIGNAAAGAKRAICRSTTCSSRCGVERSLSVGRGNPGDAAERDALIRQFARFFGARLAIDAVRIGFAVMNAARFLGEALADIIAIRLDLTAQLNQR